MLYMIKFLNSFEQNFRLATLKFFIWFVRSQFSIVKVLSSFNSLSMRLRASMSFQYFVKSIGSQIVFYGSLLNCQVVMEVGQRKIALMVFEYLLLLVNLLYYGLTGIYRIAQSNYSGSIYYSLYIEVYFGAIARFSISPFSINEILFGRLSWRYKVIALSIPLFTVSRAYQTKF